MRIVSSGNGLNKIFALVAVCWMLTGGPLMGALSITNLKVQQRWPWNGLVDVTYTVVCDEKTSAGKPVKIEVSFSGVDGDRNKAVEMKSLSGQGVKEPVVAGGPYVATWDVKKDYPTFNSSAFQVIVKAKTVKEDPTPSAGRYLVVDMSGGTSAQSFPYRYSETGPDLSNETCKTRELWLREIPAGTFMMGSPEAELGRPTKENPKEDPLEDLHQVTLTKSFFIGVFPVTMWQWKNVMGYCSANRYNDAFPIGSMTHSEIRGSQIGQQWPEKKHAVDEDSFLGRIRAKTGLIFDLPTEAQWEYACRAGTTTALNSGKDLTDAKACPEVKEVGCYYDNSIWGVVKVGLYKPNAWGLYDMHGNVWEWCLDHFDYYQQGLGTAPVTDPVGTLDGPYICRGGSCNKPASDCRSARRIRFTSDQSEDLGFRLVIVTEDK